jgi:protein SCO1
LALVFFTEREAAFMEKRFLWIGIGILLLVVLAAATAIILRNANQPFHASVLNPPSPASDFSLTSQTGTPVRLSDYRGKYVLLYFGYSHCTEECPVNMAVLAKALYELGDQAGQFQVILISTDPVGDTPQSMGEFLGRFDPTFIGAIGTLAQLQPVWKDYGVTVLDGGETHSTYNYVIDPAGNLRLTFSSPFTAEQVVADLKLLMRKN